jgi:hypothetical protein
MKKILLMILTFAIMFSFSFAAIAADNNGKANGKDDTKVEQKGAEKDKANVEEKNTKGQENKAENALKNSFKKELTEQKKELIQQKADLNSAIGKIQEEYDALIASGSTDADQLLASIVDLQDQILALKSQIKQVINERYMVNKTTYSAEELEQFDSAAALIEQMYADATVLGAGSITINDNVIKLEAPAYIKGGKTIFPIKTITEELGAVLTWDELAQTVTVTKDNISVVFSINSKSVYVDGVEQELEVAPVVNCGHTYIPLDFLADIFGLEITWDSDDETVTIEELEE